jgi:hypothetical protein
MGENLNKDTKPCKKAKGANKEHEKGLADMKRIEPSNSRASEAEKSPFSSNIVLVSIALTLLISSICLGYVSKSKYSDITAMQNKVQYLKSEGSLNIQKCGDEKDWRWCVQIDPTVEKLYNNKFAVVQETN